MKQRSVFTIAISVLFIACLFISPPSSLAAKTLKIGIVDCYWGPASTYTNDVRDAFNLEVEKINKTGGIMGRKIEVLTRDSKFKDITCTGQKPYLMARMGIGFVPDDRRVFAEQNLEVVLGLSDRGYIIDNGVIRYHGTRDELQNNQEIWSRYLSV